MSTLLRSARKLLLGETWVVPLGVAVVVGGAAVLRALDASLWSQWGGAVLVLGVVAVLWACTGSHSLRRTRKRRAGGS